MGPVVNLAVKSVTGAIWHQVSPGIYWSFFASCRHPGALVMPCYLLRSEVCLVSRDVIGHNALKKIRPKGHLFSNSRWKGATGAVCTLQKGNQNPRTMLWKELHNLNLSMIIEKQKESKHKDPDFSQPRTNKTSAPLSETKQSSERRLRQHTITKSHEQ